MATQPGVCAHPNREMQRPSAQHARLVLTRCIPAVLLALAPTTAAAQAFAPTITHSYELPPHQAGVESSYAVISDYPAEQILQSDPAGGGLLDGLGGNSLFAYDETDRTLVGFDQYWRRTDCCPEAWGWQMLPDGLIYPSYLAGRRESRFASHIAHESDQGWLWDVTLGGRVGIVRYGTFDRIRPEGWQLDIEGAAFPRLDLNNEAKLIAADFRFGVPLTYSDGPLGIKLAYYHLSSHIGDEIIFRDSITTRINFSRDVLLFGIQYWFTEILRLYAETGYGFYADEGTDPWEFQFGADFIAAYALVGSAVPFFAINGHLREEVNFGGNLNIETGLAWRGDLNAHLLRAGISYFNGKTVQFSFVNEHEEQIAFAIWYDY